jgi:hypothetical protein
MLENGEWSTVNENQVVSTGVFIDIYNKRLALVVEQSAQIRELDSGEAANEGQHSWNDQKVMANWKR